MRLNPIVIRLYQKIVQRWQGIPVIMITYKPWKKGKNCELKAFEFIAKDEYLTKRFNEIGDYIRAKYQEDMDKLLKEC